MSRGAPPGPGPGAPPAGTPRSSLWRGRPRAFLVRLTPDRLSGGESGARFGPDLAFFHDCEAPALAQVPAGRDAEGGTRFGVRISTGGAGAYASLAADLPGPALPHLTGAMILRAAVYLPQAGALQLRLNLRAGAETFSAVEEVAGTGTLAAEYELAQMLPPGARAVAGWVDAILDPGRTPVLTLADLHLSLHPRLPI